MFEDLKVKKEKKVNLNKISTTYNINLSKEEIKEKTEKNIEIISEYQEKLYAEGEKALLIILQSMDAGGKDGTIRSVFGPLNPQGCSVTSFKVPTKLELSHDFLWRIHQNVPEKGMIKIFNRSHYEDVLVVRVHDLIDDEECEKRFFHINNFEKLLFDSGTYILKFYLHISKEEQKERFLERINDPKKQWKMNIKDLEERKLWDKYMRQYELVFEKTSTDYAPWYIIPSDKNKIRNYIISEIVRETLEKINPEFPEIEFDLKNIVIED